MDVRILYYSNLDEGTFYYIIDCNRTHNLYFYHLEKDGRWIDGMIIVNKLAQYKTRREAIQTLKKFHPRVKFEETW